MSSTIFSICIAINLLHYLQSICVNLIAVTERKNLQSVLMREFVFILFEMKAKMKIVGISLGNTTNEYITQNRSDAIGDKMNAIQKREEKTK